MKIIRWILGRVILILDFLTRPKKLNREKKEQNKFDQLLKNYSMYEFHTCPFCVKVRRYLRKNSLNIEIRDARKNKEHRKELKDLGGKIQVPCLRIKRSNNEIEWLYESKDIIEHLDSLIKS
jgi:glutaredoxin